MSSSYEIISIQLFLNISELVNSVPPCNVFLEYFSSSISFFSILLLWSSFFPFSLSSFVVVVSISPWSSVHIIEQQYAINVTMYHSDRRNNKTVTTHEVSCKTYVYKLSDCICRCMTVKMGYHLKALVVLMAIVQLSQVMFQS